MRSTMTILAVATTLAACVNNAPIEGVVQGSGEKFAGVATGSLNGTLEITSGRTSCRGAYVVGADGKGRGTFVCSDGRTGPFEFTKTGQRAVGSFLTQPFIITFS